MPVLRFNEFPFPTDHDRLINGMGDVYQLRQAARERARRIERIDFRVGFYKLMIRLALLSAMLLSLSGCKSQPNVSGPQQICNTLTAADFVIKPLEADPNIGADVKRFRVQAGPVIELICLWAQAPDSNVPPSQQVWDLLDRAEAFAGTVGDDETATTILLTVTGIRAILLSQGFPPPIPPPPSPPPTPEPPS